MKGRKGKNIYASIFVVVAILVLVSIALTSSSLARYVTKRQQSGGAVAASFEVTANSQFTTSLSIDNLYPGQQREWSFSVVSRSEVATKCKAVISSMGNLPLTYVIKFDSVVVSPDLLYTFAPKNDATHNVTVIIQWLDTEENRDMKYAGRVDIVTLTLIAEQVV